MGKRIVVDASVAQSAGWETATRGPSIRCRKSLEAILTFNHEVVFSQECLDEWKRHRSSYSKKWLYSMFSRKKVVPPEDLGRNEVLRGSLAQAASSSSSRKAIEKDAHLLESALQADRIVISRDETIRALFRQCCTVVAEIRAVLWANPELDVDNVVPWLESGAKMEPSRRLGNER